MSRPYSSPSSPLLSKKSVNAMTVDVEDYFHVSAFEPHISRADWDHLPCRVERNTERVLELFAQRSVKATFFMLGWVAERCPGLVANIVSEGHELASHGYSHIRIPNQKRDDFREDVARTKKLLEDLGGCEVNGYRAATFSIVKSTWWALSELRDVGYKYSSSIYPVRHDLYGIPDASRFAFYPDQDSGLLEVPITTLAIFNRRVPCGGGGYFRLFPYAMSRWAMRRINEIEQEPCIFYFHPWEVDPEQPRQSGLSMKTRVRHYFNLDRMEQRLDRLLQDFSWGRMDAIFLNQQ